MMHHTQIGTFASIRDPYDSKYFSKKIPKFVFTKSKAGIS
jgi:hypothetical protein